MRDELRGRKIDAKTPSRRGVQRKSENGLVDITLRFHYETIATLRLRVKVGDFAARTDVRVLR